MSSGMSQDCHSNRVSSTLHFLELQHFSTEPASLIYLAFWGFYRLLSLLLLAWRKSNGTGRGKVSEETEASSHYGRVVLWKQGKACYRLREGSHQYPFCCLLFLVVSARTISVITIVETETRSYQLHPELYLEKEGISSRTLARKGRHLDRK